MKIKESLLKNINESKPDTSNEDLAKAINNLGKIVSTPIVINPPTINNIIDVQKLAELMPKQVNNSTELKLINDNLTIIAQTMLDKPTDYEMDMKRSMDGHIYKVVVKVIK